MRRVLLRIEKVTSHSKRQDLSHSQRLSDCILNGSHFVRIHAAIASLQYNARRTVGHSPEIAPIHPHLW